VSTDVSRNAAERDRCVAAVADALGWSSLR
jgi:hypothetical protein